MVEFASGLYAYVRKGLIDYKLGRMLLIFSIPAALLGTWVAQMIPSDVLKAVLGVGLLVLASSFWRLPEPTAIEISAQDIAKHEDKETPQIWIKSTAGESFCYTIANRTEGQLLITIGGLFLGMMSTGLGELNGYFLLRRCQVPSQVAVATSVFIVALTALTASVGHVIQFAQTDEQALDTVLSLVIFTAPGVLIGAQFGSVIASRLSPSLLERGMGILFILVGALLLGEVLLRTGSYLWT